MARLTPNSAGEFEILDLGEGDYHVVVEAPGFQTFQQDIHFSFPDRTRIRLNVRLDPSASASGLTRGAARTYEDAVRKSAEDRHVEAIALYRQVLGENSAFYPARHNLGAELLKTGDAAGASEAFANAIEYGGRTPEALFLHGLSLFRQDRFLEALARFRECESKAGDETPETLEYFLGMSYLQTGNPRLAEDSLKRALEKAPQENTRAHLGLAWLYLDHLSRRERARFHLEAFLRAHPDDPLASCIRETLAQLR